MIEGRISQANGRLKAAKVGVSIELVGGRLCLRGTFPPRPGATQKKAHQQRLFLGHHANPTGVKLAEQEARVVGTLLERKEFNWEPYLKLGSTTPETCGEWVTRLKVKYFQEGGTETTWEGDYQKIFKKLPLDEPITAEVLRLVVDGTSQNSKTRKRACMAISVLAKFAAVDYDPSPYAGNYGPKRVSPRDLPDDRTIAELFYKLKNPAWRWVYGMMATYGLRNHEVFKIDFEQLQQGNMVLSVLEATKTGSRRVWPCYPEWFEQFDLANVQLPRINLERTNEKIGNSVTDYFRDTAKLPFVPYTLRHCWAIRTLEFGLADTLAAQQMGHSVAVHTEQYHHWITDRHHQRAFEVVMMRGDRPLPPEIPS
jgi:integrase